MNLKEKFALAKAGIIIGTPKYHWNTESVLLPHLLLKFNWISWPNLAKVVRHEVGTNTSVVSFSGKKVGISIDSNGEKLGISLDHPMGQYWLSFLQPVWNEMKKDKCSTCHGSGWDGETYTISCFECGGSGKPKKL